MAFSGIRRSSFAVQSQRRASSAVLERKGCWCSALQSRVARETHACHTHMFTHTCAHMFTHMSTRTSLHTSHTHVRNRVHTHICAHTCFHSCPHTRPHTPPFQTFYQRSPRDLECRTLAQTSKLKLWAVIDFRLGWLQLNLNILLTMR